MINMREETIIMFVAIINVPGYVSEQLELPEFDTITEAWEYLRDERLRDLEDLMNDEDDYVEDQCADELEGMAYDEPKLGTVYGPTPGYDGDHDLGLAYSVVRQEMAK